MSLENILTGNLIKKSFHLDNGFSTSTTETHAKLQNERSTNEINSTNILNNHIMSTNWIAILSLSNTLISLLYENGFDTCVVWHEYECDSGVSGEFRTYERQRYVFRFQKRFLLVFLRNFSRSLATTWRYHWTCYTQTYVQHEQRCVGVKDPLRDTPIFHRIHVVNWKIWFGLEWNGDRMVRSVCVLYYYCIYYDDGFAYRNSVFEEDINRVRSLFLIVGCWLSLPFCFSLLQLLRWLYIYYTTTLSLSHIITFEM